MIGVSRRMPILGIALTLSLAGCNGATVPTFQPGPTDHSTGPSAGQSTPAPTAASSPSPVLETPSSAGAWLPAGELQEPRNATSAVPLGSGEVLVVGSDYETTWLSACGASTDGSDSVEIGDPITGKWERTASLSSLRDAPVVVGLPDGRALMTGGAAGESIGWSAFSSTYLFDPGTRTWARSGLLNTARTLSGSAVLADGRVLVAGGLFMDRDADEQGRTLDSTEIWDPGTGTWSHSGRLAQGRFQASAVTLADGRVLVVGGPKSRENQPIPDMTAEIFDPRSGTWSPAGMLSSPLRGFALVALADGGAIAAGGRDYGRVPAPTVSTVERFDPTTNRWTAAADLPSAVLGASGVRLADGRVLLAGGVSDAPFETGLSREALLFDPSTGSWTDTASMPSGRAGASAVTLSDGSVLLVGGSISGGEPDATPGCPEAHPSAIRYVPGA
jgi:N-acetylneuraminic acid mutarotase